MNEHKSTGDHDESGWKHWGLMLLCCLPMVALLVLFAVGVFAAR